MIGLGVKQRTKKKKKGFSLERERKERGITIFGFCWQNFFENCMNQWEFKRLFFDIAKWKKEEDTSMSVVSHSECMRAK